MLIQIRGPNGSGKTTIVKNFMDQSQDWNAHYIPQRRHPVYYRLEHKDDKGKILKTIIVLGHYESKFEIGGVDTLGSYIIDNHYGCRGVELVRKLNIEFTRKYKNVLIIAEGLMLGEDVHVTSKMRNVQCIYLTTPLEECVKRIEKRREKKGNTKSLIADKGYTIGNSGKRKLIPTLTKITRKSKYLLSTFRRLTELGVQCMNMSEKQTLDYLIKLVNE